MKRRMAVIMIVFCGAALLAGCGDGNQRPWGSLEDCKQENTDLSMQVQTLNDQNTQLTEQVKTLLALDSNIRFEAINTLEKIRIGKRTGFYDKDKDSSNETLVVYLEPLDTAQDTIKAVGTVGVELWDLSAAEDKAKLTEWTVEPADLHTTWGGNIFDAYYRIKLPLEIVPDPQKEYTLKVTFTDYLSGKVLTEQKTLSGQ